MARMGSAFWGNLPGAPDDPQAETRYVFNMNNSIYGGSSGQSGYAADSYDVFYGDIYSSSVTIYGGGAFVQTTQNPQSANPQNTPDQQSRFDAAKADLMSRLGANNGHNPCADLFGGYKKAVKALNATKFSFMNLGAPLTTDVPGEFVHAATKGENVYINSQGGFMAVNGKVPTQFSMLADTDRPNERAFVTRAAVPGGFVEFRNDVKFASFMLFHELGHRRGIYGNDDKDAISDKNGTSLDKTERNNKKILDACFPP